MKTTIKSLRNDLTNHKKANKKKIVLDVIKKWLWEFNKNKSQFKECFLSDKLDEEFDKLKDKIGDFKGIKKMSVLSFLANIILGSKDKFFNELNKEFLKIKEEFYKNKK